MHITDKELQKLIKSTDYKGCKNCKYRISPLRSCKWSEQGGDGHIHLLCPKWDKVESRDNCGANMRINRDEYYVKGGEE